MIMCFTQMVCIVMASLPEYLLFTRSFSFSIFQGEIHSRPILLYINKKIAEIRQNVKGSYQNYISALTAGTVECRLQSTERGRQPHKGHFRLDEFQRPCFEILYQMRSENK